MSGADDNGSMSSGTGSSSANDIIVDQEDQNIPDDLGSEFKEAIGRLDNVQLEPDHEMSEIHNDDMDDSCNDTPETESIGAVSSAGSEQENQSENQTNEEKIEEKGKSPEIKKEKAKRTSKISKAGSSVFNRLKKLTKFDKQKSPNKHERVPCPQQLKEKAPNLKDIKVDRLPQYFVAKYLGKREVPGVFGLHHVRQPVDELVGKVKKSLLSNETVELPLVYIVVSAKGLDIREHTNNNIKGEVVPGLIPIDFISYGVQDMKYWRVFTFIVVNEISSRTKQLECHAYLCDSTINARRMALALGASFSVYKRKLSAQGKAHNFQVELRPPDELAEAYGKEEDCEA